MWKWCDSVNLDSLRLQWPLVTVFWIRTKMFKNTFQSGFLSILYSIGSKPLQIWDKKVRNGKLNPTHISTWIHLALSFIGFVLFIFWDFYTTQGLSIRGATSVDRVDQSHTYIGSFGQFHIINAQIMRWMHPTYEGFILWFPICDEYQTQ